MVLAQCSRRGEEGRACHVGTVGAGAQPEAHTNTVQAVPSLQNL
jgi:hypothetical protein